MAGRPGCPAGWRRASGPASRRAALAAIAWAWPDITPGSVRGAVPRHRPGPPFAHELIAAQAARRPGATAVIAPGTRLSYASLEESANRLARYLMELGPARRP